MSTKLTVGHITRAITRNKKTPWPEVVRRVLKRHGYTFSGPYGLRCAFIVGRKGTRMRRELEIHNSPKWTIGKRDYRKVEHAFPSDSIGALNKLQYALIEIPAATPFSEAISKKRNYSGKAAQ